MLRNVFSSFGPEDDPLNQHSQLHSPITGTLEIFQSSGVMLEQMPVPSRWAVLRDLVAKSISESGEITKAAFSALEYYERGDLHNLQAVERDNLTALLDPAHRVAFRILNFHTSPGWVLRRLSRGADDWTERLRSGQDAPTFTVGEFVHLSGTLAALSVISDTVYRANSRIGQWLELPNFLDVTSPVLLSRPIPVFERFCSKRIGDVVFPRFHANGESRFNLSDAKRIAVYYSLRDLGAD